MTRQIAVRLPDELVDFVDKEIAEGRARSRAAVVDRALQRERRRAIAARDVAVLRGSVPEDDLDALAGYAATQPLDDLD